MSVYGTLEIKVGVWDLMVNLGILLEGYGEGCLFFIRKWMLFVFFVGQLKVERGFGYFFREIACVRWSCATFMDKSSIYFLSSQPSISPWFFLFLPLNPFQDLRTYCICFHVYLLRQIASCFQNGSISSLFPHYLCSI